jgi:hypothetical protein
MPRLIDAYKVRIDRDDFDTYSDYITALDAVTEAPTVDAVPVIRCKDCKRWNRNDGMFKDFDEREWHHCPHLGIDTDGYFSCIEGKIKEE